MAKGVTKVAINITKAVNEQAIDETIAVAKGKKEVSEKVKKISEGVVSTAVDLVLISLYFGFEFAYAGYSARGYRADEKAYRALSEFNHQTLVRAFKHLKQKGLIRVTKEKTALPKITAEGRKKLSSLIPHYDKKRIWDERIYLVTYDLPVTNDKDRNLLREFLKKIGCGMMQHSVWITPYNPKELIEEFVKARRLDNHLVIVSSLGKDGTIGDCELSDLLDEVYKLTELDTRYAEFIAKVEGGELSTRGQILFSYLSILRDDPQLPFELLPDGWLGEKAYRLIMHVHP
jgi:DNA-binding transcriptional regulator PaaX